MLNDLKKLIDESHQPFSGMLKKNPAAVALGKLGGKSTSPAKKKALQENLKKARAAKKLKHENNNSTPNT